MSEPVRRAVDADLPGAHREPLGQVLRVYRSPPHQDQEVVLTREERGVLLAQSLEQRACRAEGATRRSSLERHSGEHVVLWIARVRDTLQL